MNNETYPKFIYKNLREMYFIDFCLITKQTPKTFFGDRKQKKQLTFKMLEPSCLTVSDFMSV